MGRIERLAKTISGTEAAEKIVGTKFADHINSLGGNDVVLGYAGADKIRGGNDKQYGGRGNDVIYSEGGFRDLVNCGKGTDTAHRSNSRNSRTPRRKYRLGKLPRRPTGRGVKMESPLASCVWTSSSMNILTFVGALCTSGIP